MCEREILRAHIPGPDLLDQLRVQKWRTCPGHRHDLKPPQPQHERGEEAELQYPGWLSKLLTHPVKGLENYQEMMRLLTEEKSAIKVFVNVAKE